MILSLLLLFAADGQLAPASTGTATISLYVAPHYAATKEANKPVEIKANFDYVTLVRNNVLILTPPL